MRLPGPLSFGEDTGRSRKVFAYSWGASLTAHLLVIGVAVMLGPRAFPTLPGPEVVAWQVLLVDSDGSEKRGPADADQSPLADATTHISAQPASELSDLPSPIIQTTPPSFVSRRAESQPEGVEQGARATPAERRVALADKVRQPKSTDSTVSTKPEAETPAVARPVTAESPAQGQPASPAPSAEVSEPMVPALPTVPESGQPEMTASLRPTAEEQTSSMPDMVRHDASAIEEIRDRVPAPQGTGAPEPGSEGLRPAANLASEATRPLVDSPKGSNALAESSSTRDVDYGWLVNSIRGRILDLKQYPIEARLNRYEGRVVVRAVISEAGELLDVSVVQSSGHEVLDHDAIDLLRRVCPITMREPLQRQSVAVKVPVSYSLRH